MTSIYSRCVKPTVDIAVAVLMLIIVMPLLVLLGLLTFLIEKHNPIFIQNRVGKNGVVFKILKLRTISLHNHGNISVWGRFLRSTSLDEIPQIINIILGQMSFVGPRPLLVDYLSLYTSNEEIRHLVKPGLTGLVQISGGNILTWRERFRLDKQYVKTMGFLKDLRIIWKTISKGCFIKDFRPSEGLVL